MAGPGEGVTTKTDPREETRTRLLPPYNVILENDDYHTQGFVVGVLCEALGYSAERSYQLMMEAHTSGRAVVWTGAKEVAELKVEQIRTFHEKPYGPLGCTIEPAPGG
jgi:ATP-dependent Clp protease adaptor protein ClpS